LRAGSLVSLIKEWNILLGLLSEQLTRRLQHVLRRQRPIKHEIQLCIQENRKSKHAALVELLQVLSEVQRQVF
jgi:hypothetical protein